jgi:hypothetical protein
LANGRNWVGECWGAVLFFWLAFSDRQRPLSGLPLENAAEDICIFVNFMKSNVNTLFSPIILPRPLAPTRCPFHRKALGGSPKALNLGETSLGEGKRSLFELDLII